MALPSIEQLDKIRAQVAATFPDGVVPTVAPWRLRPCTASATMAEMTRLEAINDYFTQCAQEDKRPLLTEMALAGGYSGVTEMRRAAMRNPRMRHALSRAFTAVAAGYEEMIGKVSGQGPIFMLQNIPDYDDLMPAGVSATQPFQSRLIVEGRVAGVSRPEDEGTDMTPRTAYLKLIKGELIGDEPSSSKELPQGEELMAIVDTVLKK